MPPEWSGIELRHLAALTALAEHGSFRGAAESLGYVQSAVSQQLAHLERLLDVRLVERRRGRGPIFLTDAGEVLLSHSTDILACFNAARADLDQLKDGRRGQLHVGVSEAVATRLLPMVVPRLRRDAPHITLRTAEGVADQELWQMVESGRIDAAFCGLPLEAGPFEWVDVLEDPYVLVVAADSQFVPPAAVLEPDRLSRLPLIDHRLMRHVEAQLRPRGFAPRYVFRSDADATVQALVRGGVGCAVLPRLAVDDGDEAIRTVPLDSLVAPRAVGIGWSAARRAIPGLDAFTEAVRVVSAVGELPAASPRSDGSLSVTLVGACG